MLLVFIEFESQRTAKSYTALQTAHHRFNIYAVSFVALALWRGDGHRKLVTRFGEICEYNESFGFRLPFS